MTPQELAELDLAVALAERLDAEIAVDGVTVIVTDHGRYQPTRDGAEAMRLLEKYRIELRSALNSPEYCGGPKWMALGPPKSGAVGHGDMPAIAVCRAVVAIRWSK